jgi:hypothetical protein
VLVLFVSWRTANYYNSFSFVLVLKLIKTEGYNRSCSVLEVNVIDIIYSFCFSLGYSYVKTEVLIRLLTNTTQIQHTKRNLDTTTPSTEDISSPGLHVN